jgi:hypothetical protein
MFLGHGRQDKQHPNHRNKISFQRVGTSGPGVVWQVANTKSRHGIPLIPPDYESGSTRSKPDASVCTERSLLV